MSAYDFDVVIIGGGPGGAAMASYLAKANVNCAVFERELFPRQHVGESLVPAANRELADLGLLDAMDECGFPRKYGATWTVAKQSKFSPTYEHNWDELQAQTNIAFGARADKPYEVTRTWHVDRAKFDTLLLQNAAKLGANVYQGTRISKVEFDDDGVTATVRIGKRDEAVRAKIIVDASGRKTFLGNQMKLRVGDKVFQQMAIHTWFSGVNRRALVKKPEHVNYINIHFLPITATWVWQIPISDTITSIGVVTQKEYFSRSRKEREAFFWECISAQPALHAELQAAERVRSLKEEGDYSYAMKEVVGDRWLLVGDSARFVDPIFSSGISVALTSARLACPDIVAALKSGKFTKESYGDYERVFRRGVRTWYKFITLYYRLNVLFTYFLQTDEYKYDVLRLLQGDVYDEDEPPVLKEMERQIAAVESNPNHPWHNLLGNLTADNLSSAL
ncbi:MAG TPA: NAD(P)/FAD-dependent oxidoreductase [Kofleriaceae bacterium]|nr:NAD(P)/FAD-dependent oxidoreductase [Kofleriaceae bacterium]